MSVSASTPEPMNRTLAHFLGWGSLFIGGVLVAMVMLVPPALELHYAQWERDWIQACARTQQEQVESYEQFASALASNDPVLLQRLAHHHLRLKPVNAELVRLTDDQLAFAFHTGQASTSSQSAGSTASDSNSKAPLIEQWLHKSYPVVGIDHPAYEPPDHMAIRLATGPKRLILLALGGMFLLCGLMLPGPAPIITANTEEDDNHDDDDDGEFVHAVIDDSDDDDDDDQQPAPLHRVV